MHRNVHFVEQEFRQDSAGQFCSAKHQWGSLGGSQLDAGLGWKVQGGFTHVPAAESNNDLYSSNVDQMPSLV